MRMAVLLFVLAVLLGGCAGSTPAAAPGAAAERPTATLAQRGQVLFRNKGCISCHTNSRVAGPQSQVFEAGWPGGPPDLSNYRNDPDFLRRWLADPKAVRPTTNMPTLGLSDEEIEALIAFINEPR